MIGELKQITDLLYSRNDLCIQHVDHEHECKEYYGCNFAIGAFRIKFRKAKITPKKQGQFVTLWKRNSNSHTEPFDVTDDVDFYIIAARQDENIGFFFFSRQTLAKHNILTHGSNPGKRGFRIYPPWDKPLSRQAIGTQRWQLKSFVDLTDGCNRGIEKIDLMNRK